MWYIWIGEGYFGVRKVGLIGFERVVMVRFDEILMLCLIFKPRWERLPCPAVLMRPD